MDICGGGGGWQLWKPRGDLILKSRTPEIRFPASWEVIFYRKVHYKLEVWERVDRDCSMCARSVMSASLGSFIFFNKSELGSQFSSLSVLLWLV